MKAKAAKRAQRSEITAVYADRRGNICEAEGVRGMGRIGSSNLPLRSDDLIPLPESADLMFMPDHLAAGQGADGTEKRIVGTAVAAILPQGYTRTHLPAFDRMEGAAPLPLYGYTAVVSHHGQLCVAAVYTDENEKWDPANYNGKELKKLVRRTMKELPHNRIVEQVGNCSLNYHCLTAQNLFYRRWECGVPTSPVCNANCLGCISLQSSECCPSPQERITFSPTPEEIAEVGIYHLSIAPDGIISFGQGCEGEPSLAADRIAEGIRRIRAVTQRGQINMNSNAGFPAGMRKIVDAGLDSLRVSIISARDESYDAYYRASYPLDNVKESLRYALDHGVYVSLNLLHFPGFTDRVEELAAWQEFFRVLPVQMIQMRNLNIDPTIFLQTMPQAEGAPVGTRAFMEALHAEFPQLVIGSFSHYVND
ncbi:radical SAM protein [Selenomonas sp. oral taxon 138]|uniref:radical SAM protein n=1 Tax=Selenomonas sp. oral taxon 138 TaxID=712532 RepID=UPI0002A22538|nr:radical SAM protein [Selenomonas sp. oral taxon 138]EKX98468.1 radical SAM domain protein [Selenomonas sp. oral taxon 138 str. F0429]